MNKFKKVLLLCVFAVVAVVASACGKSEYKADGVFTAFSTQIHAGGPQVTTVSVTIKKGKVTDFFIDCIQNDKVVDGEKVTYSFKEKSKKQLGYLYGMHNVPNAEAEYDRQDLTTEAGMAAYKKYLADNNKLEWFEQAELIEDFFVKEGVDKVTTDDKGVIDNIATVTIKNGNYIETAKKALELAKEGKTQVLTTSGTNIVWVTAEVDKKGKIIDLELNTLQGRVVDGAFVWNEKNKQELGYLYGMHNVPNAEAEYERQDLTTEAGMAAYKKYLADNNKLEWFEQAKLITDYVLENGVDKLKSGADGDGIDGVASVTITTTAYVTVIKEAYKIFG